MTRELTSLLLFFCLLAATRMALGQDSPATFPNGHEDYSDTQHDQAMAEEAPPGEEPVEGPDESLFIWVIEALGWRYAFLLPFSALVSFVITAILATRGKGRSTGAAMMFVVAIPAVIGLVGMFDGILGALMMSNMSSNGYPRPRDVIAGVSTGLVCPIMGLLFMVPSYILATIGLTSRSLKGD